MTLFEPVLSIYGSGYAHGTTLLMLLAVATLPRSLVQLTWSLDRVAGRPGRAAVTQLALALMVLGGSWVLLGRMGVNGVGIAWTGGNLIIALVRLPTVLGAARRFSPARTHRGAPARLQPRVSASGARHIAQGGLRRRGPGRHRAPVR